MAKTKQQFHKIVLHPNRWLAWAIAISVLVAFGLIGYIQVSSQSFETEVAIPDASRNWRQYTNSEYGFSLNLPPSWSAQTISGAVASFAPRGDLGQAITITVKDAKREAAARASLEGFTEEEITVGGIAASKFSSGAEQYVLVKREDKLFVIKSSSLQLDRILATFIFIQ
ncbi:MAG: hypothetical protein HY545_02580 [Candidatus Doudnabacteria bacterium]|nr:hypothetical protein [Candidatus Doudnabacteria bacterium]